jgi:hypothetical protein
VQLYRYSVTQSSDFCRHNTLCCFSVVVYFAIYSVRKLLDTPLEIASCTINSLSQSRRNQVETRRPQDEIMWRLAVPAPVSRESNQAPAARGYRRYVESLELNMKPKTWLIAWRLFSEIFSRILYNLMEIDVLTSMEILSEDATDSISLIQDEDNRNSSYNRVHVKTRC